MGTSRAGNTHTRSDTDYQLLKTREPLSVDDRRQRLVSVLDRDRHPPDDGVAQPVTSDGPTGDQYRSLCDVGVRQCRGLLPCVTQLQRAQRDALPHNDVPIAIYRDEL